MVLLLVLLMKNLIDDDVLKIPFEIGSSCEVCIHNDDFNFILRLYSLSYIFLYIF